MENSVVESVRVVVLDPMGRVLLVRPTKQIRSADGKYVLEWSWPGGKLEAGESPEDAAVREVQEETGWEIEIMTKIGERDHPTYPAYVHYFAALAMNDAGKELPTPEIQEIRWIRPEEVADYFDQEVYRPITDYLAMIRG